MSLPINNELIRSIMSGDYKRQDVEEKLYADTDTLSTELTTVEEGTVPEGHEGMVVSIAVSADATAVAYIKRDGKQFYENGLNCGGLSDTPQAAGTAGLVGVDDEVFLGVRIKEKGKWELGFKATSGTPTVNWRLRVRHFRKK